MTSTTSTTAPTQIHDRRQVEAVRRQLRIDPHHLRRLRHALQQDRLSDEAALRQLPQAVRADFAARVALHPLQLVQEQRSQQDGSVKLLLRTSAGQQIETVVLDTPTGRTSLCLSSQSGCRAGCRFCATAALPAHNLTAGEILDQLVRANQRLRPAGRRVRNVVFMGMGEPLHNEPMVTEALESLTASHGFNMSPQRIVLSTVGVPDGMRRLATRFPRLRIALSLHSADPQVRQRLIPLAARHPLAELRRALQDVVRIQGQSVMIQYLMLQGRTDRDPDARAVSEFLEGIPAHINLIPFNPIDGGAGLRATPRPRRDAFAEQLRGAGFMVTIRYSQGADIDAACGQLAGRS